MDRKKFSLVVTCRNEMKSISRWKKDILSQTRFPDEIVIVDSESNDGTTEFLNAWYKDTPELKVIVQNCKPAKGHNIGNAAAMFDIILSTDMGVRLSSNWCEELISPFEKDNSVEIVAGNTCIDLETVNSAITRAEYYIENGGFSNLKPGFVPGNRSVAYTKKVWSQLNGLAEDLTFYADDSVFGLQMVIAGYKMAFAPKAMTFWGRPNKLSSLLKEQYNYGKGDGEANIKTPVAFKLYKKKMLPKIVVPFITGLRTLQKQSNYSAIARALKKKDFIGLSLIPVLSFLRGYHSAKGYLVGYEYGNIHCLDARKRTSKSIA